MFGIKFTRRMIVGLALIYASGLAWFGEIVLPFTSLPHKPALFMGLLIAAELLFLAGIAVLGRPTYNALKDRVKLYLKNRQR
jgi:hypothetical protein